MIKMFSYSGEDFSQVGNIFCVRVSSIGPSLLRTNFLSGTLLHSTRNLYSCGTHINRHCIIYAKFRKSCVCIFDLFVMTSDFSFLTAQRFHQDYSGEDYRSPQLYARFFTAQNRREYEPYYTNEFLQQHRKMYEVSTRHLDQMQMQFIKEMDFQLYDHVFIILMFYFELS